MNIAIIILATIGALSSASALVVLGILIFGNRRQPLPETHPETQDDFRVAMQRWTDMQQELRK